MSLTLKTDVMKLKNTMHSRNSANTAGTASRQQKATFGAEKTTAAASQNGDNRHGAIIVDE